MVVDSTRRMNEASSRKVEVVHFMHWLTDQRYKNYVIDCHLRRWLFVEASLNRNSQPEATEDALHTVFLTGRPGSTRRHLYAATRQVFRQYLRSQARLIEPPPAWFEPLLAAYRRFLTEVRGLSASSLMQYDHTVRLLW